MYQYVRELWWQRVDYYHELIAQCGSTAFAPGVADYTATEARDWQERLRKRIPQIIPHSVRVRVDYSVVSRQMQFGIQFAINEEMLEDTDNRRLVEMAFGDPMNNGSGAQLSTADQIALIHSLHRDPTRPNVPRGDLPQQVENRMELSDFIRDAARYSSSERLAEIGEEMFRLANERRANSTRFRVESESAPPQAPVQHRVFLEEPPEVQPRRRIELPRRVKSNRKVEV